MTQSEKGVGAKPQSLELEYGVGVGLRVASEWPGVAVSVFFNRPRRVAAAPGRLGQVLGAVTP